jgi:hypothetical protein
MNIVSVELDAGQDMGALADGAAVSLSANGKTITGRVLARTSMYVEVAAPALVPHTHNIPTQSGVVSVPNGETGPAVNIQ